MLAVAALLAGLIGLTLGMLGGGGSILTLPMLVYVLNVDPKQAIASSLFVVGTTSLLGVISHAKAGRVRWSIGLLFGFSGMVGAFFGGKLASFIPSVLLLIGFAVMMLATAFGMLRGRRASTAVVTQVPVPKAIALGVGVGLISGLVGAGGGFLVVPALTLLAGLSVQEAIGTSLLVIAMQSSAGFLGHISHTELNWVLLGVVTAAAMAGSLVGARLARKLEPETLRKAFGWLVLGMGAFLLTKQMPAGAVQNVVMLCALGTISLAAIATFARRAATQR